MAWLHEDHTGRYSPGTSATLGELRGHPAVRNTGANAAIHAAIRQVTSCALTMQRSAKQR
jgi:hypothetical protein